jgi:hypothetical protein
MNHTLLANTEHTPSLKEREVFVRTGVQGCSNRCSLKLSHAWGDDEIFKDVRQRIREQGVRTWFA